MKACWQGARDIATLCVQAACDNLVVKPFEKDIVAKKLAELGMFT
jgi:hypothetical protein